MEILIWFCIISVSLIVMVVNNVDISYGKCVILELHMYQSIIHTQKKEKKEV